MASNIGPTERLPVHPEWNYAYLTGAATYVLVEGNATINSVQTGVAGGSGAMAEIFDARTGDTLDDTSKVAEVLMTTATAIRFSGDGGLALGRGLTVVLTGATVEATVSFRGLTSLNPKTAP